MSILGGIASRARDQRLEDLADPLTLGLARELRRLGVSVDVHYRGLLPLVAQYDGRAVVAESDPETIGESLREVESDLLSTTDGIRRSASNAEEARVPVGAIGQNHVVD